MKKYTFLSLLFVLLGSALFAQDDDLPPPSSKPKNVPNQTSYDTASAKKNFHGFDDKKKIDWSKFIIEPDFSFSLGSDYIDLGVSPYVGYKVWKELYLGGGITYLYTGFRNIPYSLNTGATVYANANWQSYGGGVFAQYNIWKSFFARVRFEVLYRVMDDIEYSNPTIVYGPNGSYRVEIPKVRETIPACLVGVGYNLLHSKNFFFPIMVSYNVLNPITDNTYSIYPHGWVVQLGFITIF